MTVTARDVKAARAAVQTVARRTPMLSTRTFSERAGGTVSLKAENLQRTGSFKVRGVAAKLEALGHEGCKNGVIAASAGNHAQALAATTPLAQPASPSAASLAATPRTLNEPVRCRFSALSTTVPPARSENVRVERIGVRRATVSTAARAAWTSRAEITAR